MSQFDTHLSGEDVFRPLPAAPGVNCLPLCHTLSHATPYLGNSLTNKLVELTEAERCSSSELLFGVLTVQLGHLIEGNRLLHKSLLERRPR